MTAQRSRSLHQLQLERCSECGSDLLVRDFEIAEVVCEECGFVVAEKIATKGPEWRAFTVEQRDRRKRTGDPFTFTIHDKGLSTTIDYRNQDAHGRILPPKRRAQFYRMRRWQRRARISSTIERNLSTALSSMSKICSAMNLPKIVLETASIFYRRALKKRLVRGRPIQGVAAASIYIACRKCRIGRTLSEVAHASNIDKTIVGRVYRFLVEKLGESIPAAGPAYYVSRCANHLDLTGEAETVALRVIHSAQKTHLLTGKHPLSITAAAIYIASIIISDRRTQREIAEAAEVTEVTIRNRYKDLVKKLDITIKL